MTSTARCVFLPPGVKISALGCRIFLCLHLFLIFTVLDPLKAPVACLVLILTSCFVGYFLGGREQLLADMTEDGLTQLGIQVSQLGSLTPHFRVSKTNCLV